MMTLHTAPLARRFLFEGFNPSERMVLGTAPDRQWLGFVQNLSFGSLCRWSSEEDWDAEKYVFDPHDEFIRKYATRRANLEENIKKTNSICPPEKPATPATPATPNAAK